MKRVSGSLVAAAICMTSLAASSAADTGTRSLAIAATSPLQVTGITLARGESATIVATGKISYGSQNPSCSGSNIGPAGCSAEAICTVAGPCGALVGRVGGGPAFVVGPKKTADGPGVLWLGVNDAAGAYGDNSGTFDVDVTLKAQAEVAKVLQIKTGHLYLKRAGSDRVEALRAGDRIYLGDELLTSQDGKVALEFTIGGRVHVGPGAAVTVTGDRTISGGDHDTGLDFVSKSKAKSSDAHVEIQTNGGVIGIKG